ncbi:helix-turn-helix domain-containing protein [Maridesulfovibrio salexigens]|uniref:Transcriptional regulator, XRE family n=1 Tax=Maridesulfovibrio salexigens (strain ATCC 14822 / DSM 2638 / NCIMB 8403 / VKM B-1763) TaxID=526222 RepID=C6BV70_MARSD|nr:RodZ domain-containing protein [Maridesulfovibrio salexigens]ACS80045.1 transcriptional regulator, XRE family [Maridesulfovibrio salexigens DSM 2638]
MDLKELGSRLKDERKRQGLTMEQIMEITKVSRVNITAIESGNQKEFPHEVYAKGFIKTYAKALGLDAEEIGDEFSRIMGSGTTESADDVVETVQPDYSADTKKSPVGTIILILLLAGVVGGLVYYLHDNSFFSAKNEAQTEIVAEEAVQEKPATEPQVEAPAVDEKKAEVVEPAPAEVEQSAATEAPVETKIEEQAVEQPVAAEENIVAEPVGNTVAITAKPGEACWLEAVVDGSAKEYVLQEGETLSLPFEDSLKLKLGNGGGVEIASNGKPYSFDAPKGQVKKLEFSAVQ